MGWHYAAKEFKDSDGDKYYGIVEVYPDIDGSPHTAEQVTISGESVEDLIGWMGQAIADIVNCQVVIEKD